MIPAAPLVKLALVLVSLGAHAIALFWWNVSPRVEVAGSTGVVVETQLGNSFADLAAGVADPMTPAELEPETPREKTRAPVERTVAAVLPPSTVPDQARAVPVITSPTAIPQVRVAAQTEQATIPLVSATQVPVALTPELQDINPELAPVEMSSRAAVTDTIKRSEPARPVSPKRVTKSTPLPDTAPVPELDRLEATSPEAVTSSLRPRARPERPADTPSPRASPPKPQGSSPQNAVAGSATGTQIANPNRQSSAAGRSRETGNAAASNYPGKVMQKITRVPRPRTGSKGTTVIRFAIANSGALRSLAIARSSGSEHLDQAALRIIRRAAPFPKPPTGARTIFSINITARR